MLLEIDMKLLIGTPVYNNQLDSRMVGDVIDVIGEFQERKESINWDRPSSCMLAYNRNLIAFTAIQEDYDWLLFWDADISVEDKTFPFLMIETAYKYNIPVVGVPIRLKHPTEKKWNYALKMGNLYINHEGELPVEPQRINVIGTGLMLIKVSFLKEMPQPWFHFEDTFGKDRIGFFPEDWYFCEKVKNIFLEPRIKAIHWGTFPY